MDLILIYFAASRFFYPFQPDELQEDLHRRGETTIQSLLQSVQGYRGQLRAALRSEPLQMSCFPPIRIALRRLASRGQSTSLN